MSAASCQTNTRSRPAPALVDAGERLAEREHAVIAVEVVGAHRLGVADRAMMRVVEQQQ